MPRPPDGCLPLAGEGGGGSQAGGPPDAGAARPGVGAALSDGAGSGPAPAVSQAAAQPHLGGRRRGAAPVPGGWAGEAATDSRHVWASICREIQLRPAGSMCSRAGVAGFVAKFVSCSRCLCCRLRCGWAAFQHEAAGAADATPIVAPLGSCSPIAHAPMLQAKHLKVQVSMHA